MVTDRRPSRGELRREYDTSSRLTEIRVPPPGTLASVLESLEAGREAEARGALNEICKGLIARLSEFYVVPPPSVNLLGVRPHRTREGLLASELFGDYQFEGAKIRLWTRTAVQRQWTSSRTLLSTLCHEFMHHLDVAQLEFPRSYHTTGFFERTHRLYLAVTNQRHYSLAWFPPGADGSRAIDWPETNRRKREVVEAG